VLGGGPSSGQKRRAVSTLISPGSENQPCYSVTILFFILFKDGTTVIREGSREKRKGSQLTFPSSRANVGVRGSSFMQSNSAYGSIKTLNLEKTKAYED